MKHSLNSNPFKFSSSEINALILRIPDLRVHLFHSGDMIVDTEWTNFLTKETGILVVSLRAVTEKKHANPTLSVNTAARLAIGVLASELC